jgi:hypothetical protein
VLSPYKHVTWLNQRLCICFGGGGSMDPGASQMRQQSAGTEQGAHIQAAHDICHGPASGIHLLTKPLIGTKFSRSLIEIGENLGYYLEGTSLVKTRKPHLSFAQMI